MQDRQVEARQAFGGGLAPDAAVESVQGVGEEVLLLIAQLVQGTGLDAGDLPDICAAEFH
ncbi:hypothetical protein D3C76_1322330 [compost metagenome]